MRLDDRLEAVKSFVRRGARVVDIGSDHAHLAIALAEEGASLVIATDKNEGPLSAARHEIEESGGKVELRHGDGLSVIAPGEADTIVIAGMGGTLIVSILTEGKEQVKSADSLVLQPMSGAAEVRRWLYENEWHIADEKLVRGKKDIYEVILAEKGREPIPDETDLLIGPALVRNDDPLLAAHVGLILRKLRMAARGIVRGNPDVNAEKLDEYRTKIAILETRRKNYEMRASNGDDGETRAEEISGSMG